MRRTFTATLTREDDWFIAQCLELGVASQGESEQEALANIREAVQFALSEPHAIAMPTLYTFEIDTDAA